MGPLEGPPSNSEGLGSSAAPGQQHQYSRDAGIGGEGSQNLLPSQYPLGERPPRQSDTRDEAGRTSHDSPSKKSSEQQSRTRGPGQRKPSSSRVCGKCGESLTGQFVRALGDTFHLECFTCFDCDKIVASKFFPIPETGPNQKPLCETDYFRRLDLLCFKCGGALRGSYITALDRKYHIEHFTCSVCPTVFGASDSYYEHEGDVFCHYHYSTRFAQRCNGCQTSILKQFVEIFRNGQNQHWHPECYMIHKYWNVRLSSTQDAKPPTDTGDLNIDASSEVREHVRREEEKIEQKVNWIWRTLSTFEEKSATSISDMLLHVSNAAIMEGILAAKKFIVYVELLFFVAGELDKKLKAQTPKGLTYNREARLLCKKLVAFFDLLLHAQVNGVRRLGVTQELLSLVTGLAHYLKLMIRINLQGALRYDRTTSNNDEGLGLFMDQVNSLDQRLEEDAKVDVAMEIASYAPKESDACPICQKSVETSGLRNGSRVFHENCLVCQSCGRDLSKRSEDARWSEERPASIYCRTCQSSIPDESRFVKIDQLQHYVHLLRVAHARLLATLQQSRALPHTSESPSLVGYDSNQGHRVTDTSNLEAPLLSADSRSKSYAGIGTNDGSHESSYSQTLGDIRRLKSTRLDQHLSTSMRRARSSRVIDGPEGISVGPGLSGDGQTQRGGDLRIVQDEDANGDSTNQLMIGAESLALDDIPRIVAREQAKDHRPNASRYAGGNLVGDDPQPKFVNGHRRVFSDGQMMEPSQRPKMYFSELSPLKYFIVRHIAVLSMEPLLEGQFNQEELLALIETKKAQAWWKFPKAFKKGKSKSDKDKDNAVFGRSLDMIVERDGAESTDGVGPGTLRVPSIMQDAVSAMKTMDMSVEGVFRKNGNIKRLKEIAEEIDTNGAESVDLTKENPVQVAALMKKYLRELPDPVLTFKLHKLWIAAARIQNESERKRLLHLICCLLPKVNRDAMEVLFTFLTWVSSFHTVDEDTGSKMDIHNLATVIAPNILYSNNPTTKTNMDSSFLAIEAVHTMLKWNEEFCTVPDEIVSLLNDPFIFSKEADITTKEILKRWGEIRQVPQTAVASAVTQPSRTFEGRTSAPIITRVDSDNRTWQGESSVRPVGDTRAYGPPSSQNTPPQNYSDLSTPNAPYAHGHNTGSAESYNGSPHRHSQFRSSASYQPGGIGITGAG